MGRGKFAAFNWCGCFDEMEWVSKKKMFIINLTDMDTLTGAWIAQFV
jgi:hypothetical protein